MEKLQVVTRSVAGSHDPDDVISTTEVITEVQDIKQVLLDTVRYR